MVAERDAYLLVDEEYAIGLSRSPAVGQDRVIPVSGLSRTCSLPGLRTGWVYGAPQVAEACAERTFLTSIASSVLCEALACSALDRHEDCVREYHRLCAPRLGVRREVGGLPPGCRPGGAAAGHALRLDTTANR
ncbi:aminotransferase class I/II-fold pyridoxal phosphate-dependent enzyme [Streptomyces microflavus]